MVGVPSFIEGQELSRQRALSNEAADRAAAGFEQEQETADLNQLKLAREEDEAERATAVQVAGSIAQAIRKGLESGQSLDDIQAFVQQPAIAALGVTPDELGGFFDLVRQDPKNALDNLDQLLASAAENVPFKASGQPISVDRPDGTRSLVQFGEDGRRIDTGLTASRIQQGDVRLEQRNVALSQNQPGFVGAVEEARVIGAGKGAVAVGDLDRGERETEFARRAVDESFQKAKEVDDKILQAISQVSSLSAGFASLTAIIPGTPAADLQSTINSIVANLGFDELKAMKAASPTGGALGQVTEREIAFLQSVREDLQIKQSPEQLKRFLIALRPKLAESQARVKQAFEEDFRVPYFGPGTPIPEKGASDGVLRVNPDTGLLE